MQAVLSLAVICFLFGFVACDWGLLSDYVAEVSKDPNGFVHGDIGLGTVPCGQKGKELRGVKALGPIEKGTEVLSIPLNFTLYTSDLYWDEDKFGKIGNLFQGKNSDEIDFASKLSVILHQVKKTGEPAWALGYIHSLMSMEELKMSHPMYAPAEVLDRYYSLEVGWRTKEMKRTAEKHYLELMMRLLASNSTDVLQDFTFDEYLWGTVSAKSRAFTLGEFGDIADEKGGLVPVIDMINNRNRRNLDWWWDTKTESMKVSALRDIMEGEELTIRYHPRADNAYLAFQFGFVLDKNESATSAFMPMAKIPEEKCELLCQHVEADMKIIQVDAEGGGRETESATPPEILRLFVVVADEMCKCSCERCKKKLQDKTTFCGRRADAAASSVISGFSTICSECAEMIADPYVRSTLSWWKMPACQPCEAALTAACTPAVAAVDVSCLGCETEAEAFCQDVIRHLFSSMSALVEDHPPHAVPSGAASHSHFRSPANFSISTEGQETPVSNNTHCGTLPLRDREEEAAGGQIEVQTCSQASRPQS